MSILNLQNWHESISTIYGDLSAWTATDIDVVGETEFKISGDGYSQSFKGDFSYSSLYSFYYRSEIHEITVQNTRASSSWHLDLITQDSGTDASVITPSEYDLAVVGFPGGERIYSDVIFGGNDIITGTNYDDIFKGFDGDDLIGGRNGDDVLIGGNGDDTLNGQIGRDKSFGGHGNDMFIDTDLDSGSDRLYGGLGQNVYSLNPWEEGVADVICIVPDSVYMPGSNSDGKKRDSIYRLRATDRILFKGVEKSDLNFKNFEEGVVDPLYQGGWDQNAWDGHNLPGGPSGGGSYDGVAVEVRGTLEALIFTDLTAEEVSEITSIWANYAEEIQYELNEIKDYDGNFHGGASGSSSDDYRYQGLVDLNGDGVLEDVFTNSSNGRWATVGPDDDFNNYGRRGDTRIVGLYDDPLVLSGRVLKGSSHDSQVRFQNDLYGDNLRLGAAADVDDDGLGEAFWRTTDGSAYLRSIHHADGNVKYANYMNAGQMTDYLSQHGHMGDIGSSLGL